MGTVDVLACPDCGRPGVVGFVDVVLDVSELACRACGRMWSVRGGRVAPAGIGDPRGASLHS